MEPEAPGILCKICGAGPFQYLIPHVVRGHKMKIQEYLSRFGLLMEEVGNPGGGVGAKKHDAAVVAVRKAEQQDAATKIDLYGVEDMLNELTSAERDYYNKQYAIYFRQADLDVALEASIRELVLDEINIIRIQREIQALSRTLLSDPGKVDLTRLQTLQRLSKDLRTQNLATLNSLNLTREKKKKDQALPDTTASRLMTAYEKAHKAMQEAERKRQIQDEDDAIRRLNANLEDLFTQIPTTAGAEDTDAPDLVTE